MDIKTNKVSLTMMEDTGISQTEKCQVLQGIWATPETKKANPTIRSRCSPLPITNTPGESNELPAVDSLEV